MSNIIGPINLRNWKTLRMLRYSVKQMKAANDNDLYSAIQKESSLYDELLRICVCGERDQELSAKAA